MLFRRRASLAPPAREALGARPRATRRSSSCRSRTRSTRPRTCRRAPRSRSPPRRPRGSRRRSTWRAAPGAPASARSRTSRPGWSATARTSPISSPGSRAPASTGRSSSAATPRSPASSRTACRCCARWPRSGIRCREIGIPCYPQGHAFIPDGPLLEALRDKARVRELHDDPAVLRPGRDRDAGSRRAGPRASRCRSTSACPGVAEPHKLLAISARIGVADTHRFLDEEPPVRRPARPLRRLLPPRRAARGARAASSPTRRPASSTSTCTRSTRSTRSRPGGGPTSRSCLRRRLAAPPTDPARDDRRVAACSIGPPLAPCGPQLKTTYPEWRRDRPVEATTTYRRRAGKVPIPGRFSCTIRDLSSDPSGRKGLPVSGLDRPIQPPA